MLHRKLTGAEWRIYAKMLTHESYPDSKVHGANMGPILCRQDLSGPHVCPMNLAIWLNLKCVEKFQFNIWHVLDF